MHDVSWGTKGDNTASSLGGVTVTTGADGKDVVEVEMITDHKDINNNYEKFIRNLAEPRPSENKKESASAKAESWKANFRTLVVLGWVFSNALVVVLLTNETVLDFIKGSIKEANGGRQLGNPFLQVFLFINVVYFLECVYPFWVPVPWIYFIFDQPRYLWVVGS